MVDIMEKVYELSAKDRCDHGRCEAQALTLVKFLDGELAFCGHHFAKHEKKFYDVAYDIIDERDKINPKSASSA